MSSLLCCPSNNKGCCVGSLTNIGTSSLCYYCTCYSCCRSLNVACVISAHTRSGAVSITIGPSISCRTVRMTQCGNILFVLSLIGCPFDIKGCSVSSCSLHRAGCGSFNCAGCINGFSFNETTVVSVTLTLSGAYPNSIRIVILPAISCSRIAMTKRISYRNGLVCAYRITTVTLYISSLRFCTSSIRCYYIRSLACVTMTQLGVF